MKKNLSEFDNVLEKPVETKKRKNNNDLKNSCYASALGSHVRQAQNNTISFNC